MNDNGEVKTQAEVARRLEVSRARVNQILRLLKFENERIESLKSMGGPLTSKLISERKLRLHSLQ